MIRKVFCILIALFFCIAVFGENKDKCLFEERLEKIFEIKKTGYLNRLDYSRDIKEEVSAILESSRQKIVENLVKKKNIIEKIQKIDRKDFNDINISKLINDLYDIEKSIIQVNQDQFNALLSIISPEDAFLYIKMDRRANAELRHRFRDTQRRRPEKP